METITADTKTQTIPEQWSEAAGWAFFVPDAFADALARLVKYKTSPKNPLPPSVFFKGDTFYDSPLAYQIWKEALKCFTRSIEVERDVAGRVAFHLYQVNDGKLVKESDLREVDSMEFVAFLQTGQLP